MTEADFIKLKNIVRIGTVSSVDVESRTARVTFTDKGGAEPLVSSPLQVVQNHPTIVVEKWVAGTKWEFQAQYATADRKLGLGESYTTGAPDVVTLDTPGGEIVYAGEIRPHKEVVTVYPWLPFVGQMVVCLFLPNADSDGFVIGGI